MKTYYQLKQAVLKAGQAIIQIYQNHLLDETIKWKHDNSPLTLADKEANHIIIRALKELFPNDKILSEEQEDNLNRLSSKRCWIIDPLDGTKEFIKRNGEFTINLALSVDQQPVWGMIYAPILKTLYWAEKGKGAFKQIDEGQITPLSVTNRKTGLRVVVSRSHNHPDMDKLLFKHKDKIENIISMGSSLKGCLVAEGKAEIYIRHNPTMEWDTAAMHIIVEEAGGIFRQLDHTKMYYNKKDTSNTKGFYILNCPENNFS